MAEPPNNGANWWFVLCGEVVLFLVKVKNSLKKFVPVLEGKVPLWTCCIQIRTSEGMYTKHS